MNNSGPQCSTSSDIVRAMRSLASLLEGAVRRAAFEVRLESGQPVVYTTARGTEAEASVLPRSELFDMIVAAVDDAQQIELAVGNPVDFKVDAGARWTVSAEPGQEGITVRAHRPGKPPGPLLASPPAAPPAPPPARPITRRDLRAAVGFELADPQFDSESSAPTLLSSALPPRPPSEPPPSHLYVAALDVPVVDDAGANQFIASESSGAPPFESGTWALDDDDELDVGLEEPDEDSLPTGFAPIGLADPHIGVPEDDDDANPQFDNGFDPFAEPPPPPDPIIERRHTLSPTLKAMEASSPRQATTSKLAARTPPESELSQRVTQRELGAVRSGDGSTQRELGRIDVGHDRLLVDVAEGTLVYVLEPGLADVLARSSQAPSITIGDPHDPTEVWARVRELPIGSLVIVRCEDPSTLLDGILRRLEEGYRVFVETRARTVLGARRMLLGVSASDRAERWLDEQRTLIVEPGEGGPRLVPVGK
jgi:hypothetical protein